MLWNDELQAWLAEDLQQCLCPVCGMPLKQGWQECSCGELFNVEKIDSQGNVMWLVTREHDEMQELVDRIESKKENYQTYLV